MCTGLQGPAELANPNLSQWRSEKEVEHERLRTLVTEEDGEKRVRKTHKGEEVRSLGDAKSSLGEATSSLGVAKRLTRGVAAGGGGGPSP